MTGKIDANFTLNCEVYEYRNMIELYVFDLIQFEQFLMPKLKVGMAFVSHPHTLKSSHFPTQNRNLGSGLRQLSRSRCTPHTLR